MKIGLVSDTHGFFDPRLREILQGSEVILHAGDVGSEEVLDELGRIAPVEAVRGNVDPPEAGWPLTLTLRPGGVAIHVAHILPAEQSELESWGEPAGLKDHLPAAAQSLLRALDPSPEVVIFGHSHWPCLVRFGGVLWVNPGSSGRRRFRLPRTCALLETSRYPLSAQIILLESYNVNLPKSILMGREERVWCYDAQEHQARA